MPIYASNNPLPDDPDFYKGKLDRGGYPGTAKDLKDEIDNLALPDKFLTIGIIKKVAQKVVVDASEFSWNLNKLFFENTEFETTIAPTAPGSFRIDLIVANQFSNFVKIQGDESLDLGSAQEPLTPEGTLRLTAVLISGVEFEAPPVPTFDDLSTKLDKGAYTGTAQSLKEDIDNLFIPDTVIRTTEPTRAGNKFTFPIGEYEVLLSKTRKTNTNELEITPLAATTDYKRVDLVYFKPDNTLASIQGVESTSVAVRPEVPVGSIAIYFINVFGATIEGGSIATPAPPKTTPLVDNDKIVINDSQDSEKTKTKTWSQIKAALLAYFETKFAVPQITITTSVSIATDTLDALGYSQKGRNAVIKNGVNPVNITVNGGVGFVASYLKDGTGAITFVQGVGRTLVQVDETNILDGAVGSTATISSEGTKDYLRISNV